MTPEQFKGRPVYPRPDFFSFGVPCSHMLSGAPPFRGQTALELALQHLKEEPRLLNEVRPDLPPEFCAIIHKMMAKEPDQRYPSCAEMRKDLDRFRGTLAGLKTQVSVTVLPVRTLSRGQSTPTVLVDPRRRWLMGGAALTILMALTAGGTTAWQRHRSHDAAWPPSST